MSYKTRREQRIRERCNGRQSVQVTFDAPAEIVDWLNAEAQELETSRKAIILDAIEAAMEDAKGTGLAGGRKGIEEEEDEEQDTEDEVEE